jgi:sialic acid synthase SpsE
MTEIRIQNRLIGDDHPTYFVADIAANHDRSLDRAKKLIRQAAEAGADAAKFQNFQAETIVSDLGFKSLKGKKSHQSKWKKSIFEIYADASLPLEWTAELAEVCQEVGIHYFTAPYDTSMLGFLDPYVCAWKIGSGDITWHAHIEAISRRGKPVLLATGASEMSEVEDAVARVTENCEDLVLMQCNTNYTASPDNFHFVALNVLKTFQSAFPGVVLGLSDHTPGHVTVLGAVALGARVIEKHFTDDITRTGPDHGFSMDPTTWRAMVEDTRALEAALGTQEKNVMENEEETVVVQRRAVRAAQNLSVGQIVDEKSIVPLRPCPSGGLAPYKDHLVLGKTLLREIKKGDCVRLSDVLE